MKWIPQQSASNWRIPGRAANSGDEKIISGSGEKRKRSPYPRRERCSSGKQDVASAMQGFEDARFIAAAHRNPLAVKHHDGRLSIVLGANFLHELKIDNVGTVHAEKLVRIQSLLEVGHGFAQQVGFAFGAEANVILFGANPANLGNGEEEDASARFEHDARGEAYAVTRFAAGARSVVRPSNSLADALNGGAQAFGGERLEKIVHCMNFEGPQSVLVVGSGEHDGRHGNIFSLDGADHVEAVH